MGVGIERIPSQALMGFEFQASIVHATFYSPRQTYLCRL